MEAVKIAHLSDLHLLSLEERRSVAGSPASASRVAEANAWGAKPIHKPFAVRAAARAIRELGVPITSSSRATSRAFARGRVPTSRAPTLEDELRLPRQTVSLDAGNRDDVHAPSAHESRPTRRPSPPYVASDFTRAPARQGSPFPFVRLRGPAAIIGLSTALPRPPFMASESSASPSFAPFAPCSSTPGCARGRP